jgi:hypothetical protein
MDHGAAPTSRNNEGRTPYDLAQSHVVRQYLLPLQLQYEREREEKKTENQFSGAATIQQTAPPPFAAYISPRYSNTEVLPSTTQYSAPPIQSLHQVSPAYGGVDSTSTFSSVPAPSIQYSMPPPSTHSTVHSYQPSPGLSKPRIIQPGNLVLVLLLISIYVYNLHMYL